ncbi:C-GCAxxG-C-C family protein [Desulfovibrio sp. JC022]|uniref:C-GCAxxG-C-C family protein n=1 Tax=Desulfovibrio sp. JC022 TaxID=2593642 RepID=UPI0013D801A2|nr:C-GCAxxG-C-C family protein [Desulfovibrio sp. JC022]NDV22305.1 C_GCAxxG_C_C family protein [Desulfovibrio sp. JC022]
MKCSLTQKLICESTGREAKELYGSDAMCCSEAVLWTINREFSGGLNKNLTIALSKGFCGGIGDAGCVCGALSGAVMGLSLILEKGPLPADEDQVRKLSKELHDRFLAKHGAVCCRTLSRDRDHEAESKGICLDYVESAAAICTRLLLNPETVEQQKKQGSTPFIKESTAAHTALI